MSPLLSHQSRRLHSPPAAPACFSLLFISMTIGLIYEIIQLRGKLLTPSLHIPHMLTRNFYHVLCVYSYLLSLTCCVWVIGSHLWESRQSETWKPCLTGSTSLCLSVQCKYWLSCDPWSFPWRSFRSSEIQWSIQKKIIIIFTIDSETILQIASAIMATAVIQKQINRMRFIDEKFNEKSNCSLSPETIKETNPYLEKNSPYFFRTLRKPQSLIFKFQPIPG